MSNHTDMQDKCCGDCYGIHFIKIQYKGNHCNCVRIDLFNECKDLFGTFPVLGTYRRLFSLSFSLLHHTRSLLPCTSMVNIVGQSILPWRKQLGSVRKSLRVETTALQLFRTPGETHL